MDKIVCVGKNYTEHAKELGDAVPKEPVLFLKPPSVLRSAARNDEKLELVLPGNAGSVHHECEIVLKIGNRGEIAALTVGLDMTLRDRQAVLKKAGHPWTTSKVFRDAAVAGPWIDTRDFSGWEQAPFTLTLDGKVRQEGKASEMVFSPWACVGFIGECFPLLPGDLVFTGTPAGVGPVTAGQEAVLRWGDIRYSVVWRNP